jgi:phage shock protein E
LKSLWRSLAVCSTVLAALCVGPATASWWDSASHYHGYVQRPTEQLLAALLAGRKVLFLDTREDAEFREGHIPGARTLRLRDVAQADVDALAQYEFIVPYCLKDFRAFEVARALMARGLTQVVLMEPAGLQGWRALGLPLATQPLESGAVQTLLRPYHVALLQGGVNDAP